MSTREKLILVLIIANVLVFSAMLLVPVWHECRAERSLAYCFAVLFK